MSPGRASYARPGSVRLGCRAGPTDKLGRDSRPAPAQARRGLRGPAVPRAATTPRAPTTYPPANRCTSVSLWLILSSACPPGAQAGRGASSPPQGRGPGGDARGAGGAAAAQGPPASPPGGVPDSATSARLRSLSPREPRRPYINRSSDWHRPRDVTRPARPFHVIPLGAPE